MKSKSDLKKAPIRRRKTKGKFVQKQVIVSKKKKTKKKKVSQFAKFIPRKTNFIRAHKIKTPSIDWKNTVTKSLYNGCALKSLRVIRLTEKHMELFRLRLVRELNKKIDTDRRRSRIIRDRVWTRINTSVPFTKKSIGMRMGKGKGGVSGWRVQVPAGRILIESCSKWKKKAVGFSTKVKRMLGGPSFIEQKLPFAKNRFNINLNAKEVRKAQNWERISFIVVKKKLKLKLQFPRMPLKKARWKLKFIRRAKEYCKTKLR